MTECRYCKNPGVMRATAEADNIEEDVCICEKCWRLLQDPKTAIPLIRGDLIISLRGKVGEKFLLRAVDLFVEKLLSLRAKN